MSIWHSTFASDGRNPLFRNEADYRAAVHVLGRVAGSELVLFNLVDDHIHVVLWCERKRRGVLSRALVYALRPIVSDALEPARTREVENRSHMKWLVTYLLSQTDHHGIDCHPTLWTGSCFADLIEARRVPGMSLQLRKALPRYRWRDVYAAAGLKHGPIIPASQDAARAAGIASIVSAAAAALAVDPELEGRRAATVQARRAAAQLAARVGIGTRDIAWALKVTPRSARRLLGETVDDEMLEVILVRLALESAVRGAPG